MTVGALDKTFVILLGLVVGLGCGFTAKGCEASYQILVEMEEKWE